MNDVAHLQERRGAFQLRRSAFPLRRARLRRSVPLQGGSFGLQLRGCQQRPAVAEAPMVGQHEQILQVDGPIVQPLWRVVQTGFDNKVKGFRMHPTQYIFLDELAVEKT